jgi:diadenosine tetraphosphate (Ap4A) HIT family hydrolase
MKITSALIPTIINVTKATGFNLFASQGSAAGQRIPHFSLSIIPRYENDKVNFEQPRQQFSKEQLYGLAKALSETFLYKEKREAPKEKREEKKEEKKEKAEKRPEFRLPQRIP